MINISISNKQYKVKEAKTWKQQKIGLSEIDNLPEDEGILFYFENPQSVSFTMKDTSIPLDIVFIDEDLEVISVEKGKPFSKSNYTEDDVSYVLEVNQNSGIKEGDELVFTDKESEEDDSDPVMKVLFPDGSEQMPLWGGERIVSRRETKILIKKAKKALFSQSEKDFKALGRYMFKCLKGQNERPAEYVETKDKN